MKPFETFRSVAASVDENEIDTDIIFPARFLLLLEKSGLREYLFHERRQAVEGVEPFVLDREPFNKAEILVAAKNFGTGSSREQAVWAIADFGIRTVIAESFGEIFLSNCHKNGVLPVRLPADQLAIVRRSAVAEEDIIIDLGNQTIQLVSGRSIPFDIEAFRKHDLLSGLDEIGDILAHDLADIESFEARQRTSTPWLYLSVDKLRHFDDLGKEDYV